MVNWLRNKLWAVLVCLDFTICAFRSFSDVMSLYKIYGSCDDIRLQQLFALTMLREAKKLKATDLAEFCEAWYSAKLRGEPFYDN